MASEGRKKNLDLRAEDSEGAAAGAERGTSDGDATFCRLSAPRVDVGRRRRMGGRAVVGGAEDLVLRHDGLVGHARIDHAIRVILSRENRVRRALDDLIVCVQRQDAANPTGRLAVAYAGGGIR